MSLRVTGDLTGAAGGAPAYVPAMENDTTVLVELPPGDPGSPPHRHRGPVFGYVTEGELRYEIQGRPVMVSEPARPECSEAASCHGSSSADAR